MGESVEDVGVHFGGMVDVDLNRCGSERRDPNGDLFGRSAMVESDIDVLVPNGRRDYLCTFEKATASRADNGFPINLECLRLLTRWVEEPVPMPTRS